MQVKIYQPTKTATQSGKKSSQWLLVPIIEANHKSINNVMGWTSSNNTLSQIKLKFDNSQDAMKYAMKQGWDYEIILPKTALVTTKSYSNNFI
jgi:hypothetical protein